LIFLGGDVITPRDIAYSYKLLFEDRSIPLRAYSVETVLAEKIESILSRDIANSRMRDFYDVYHLSHTDFIAIDDQILQKAIHNTFKSRNSSDLLHQPLTSLQRIATDKDLQEMWKKYQKKFEYARKTSWLDTIDAIRTLLDKMDPKL
jgi:predicted nucleotidyltransferase component of viral defense system